MYWKKISLKDRKIFLKEKLKGLSLEDKTDLLFNSFEGEECVCLATGMSLLDYSEDKVREFCKDKVVLSVKTASLKFKHVTDICVTNYYNSFSFSGNEDFLLLSRQETLLDHPNWVNAGLVTPETYAANFPFSPDVLWGCDTSGKHSNSVCNANRWKENELSKRKVNRLLGPGILNDMAIPTMVHLGVSKIYFLGWDGSLLDKKGKVKHFYDLERKYKPNLNKIRSDLDLKIVKSDLPKDEQQVVRDAEEDIVKYFASKEIDIFTLSKTSNITNNIPRHLL